MLYLLTESYDNGQMWEDHYNKTTLIGVFETKELAEKEMEKLIQKGKRSVERYNKRLRDQDCEECEDFPCEFACECDECLKEFIHTDGSYIYEVKNRVFCSTESYAYDIKEIELNKRIK